METFDSIYRQRYQAVFRLVSTLTGNETAPDIVQEIFIKLYTQMQSGHPVDYPKTWLYRVATNECLNFLTRTRKLHSLDEAKAFECPESDQPEIRVVQNETQYILQQAFNCLNIKERILLELYSESFSYREISEISGIKFSSVGKSLARALEKLKTILEHKKNEMSY